MSSDLELEIKAYKKYKSVKNSLKRFLKITKRNKKRLKKAHKLIVKYEESKKLFSLNNIIHNILKIFG